MRLPFRLRIILVVGLSSAFLVFLLGSLFRCDEPPQSLHARLSSRAPEEKKEVPVEAPRERSLKLPVRAEPESFPPDTNWPRGREVLASGPIDPATFDPARDLVRIEDDRVWWESDHDGPDDTEDDHLVHAAAERPLRRLIELVCRMGGRLEVHDAYRPKGKHVVGSLHKEGRAVDVTCDELGLEKLAKMCWAAGFDWVFHEAKARQGAHVHCSVKRSEAGK